MQQKRAKLRDIQIPKPVSLIRRDECLNNVELFLTTYFSNVFYEPFTEDRRTMMNDIVAAAIYGGDQAIAGPRGEGKTRLALYVALFLMISGRSVFPVVIGKSQSKAQNELKTIKEKLQQTKLFVDDFPEIGVPFKQVGGWSSRARMQTVNGQHTNIELAADHLIFPTIDGLDWDSCAKGQIIASMGVDGPIRGMNYRDQRPTIAIIDDMEDRESAHSDTLIEKNEDILEKDIAGLGASSERISRVMLCTIQNRKCIAYKYTDPKLKPSWRGKRFRKMVKPPERMDLVEKYIEMRKTRSINDPDAREAFRFWRDNQEDIERGHVISNPYSYSNKIHADGDPIELSACHSYYNRVADTSANDVATEIDNDPPAEVGPQGSGLTAEMVSSRKSGLQRGIVPFQASCLTCGIDLGKYNIHWVVTAWLHGGTGVVVDYGIHKVHGTNVDQNATEQIEPKIYDALLDLHDRLKNRNYTDTAGVIRYLDCVMIDSGTYTNAPYEFCRQVGGVWHPSKGLPSYKPKKTVEGQRIASSHLHAERLPTENLWLYELDTDYWKTFVQEHFLVPTFDSENNLRRGSLSLYELIEGRTHSIYSSQIVSEEKQHEFVDGKGMKEFWYVHSEQNHFLDATSYASAGSEVCGIKLFGAPEIELQARQVTAETQKRPQAPAARQHGRSNIRREPGGWMNRVRRR